MKTLQELRDILQELREEIVELGPSDARSLLRRGIRIGLANAIDVVDAAILEAREA